MICILYLIQVFCSSIFDICLLENITKCFTGNMISTSFKLLSLTTFIFILNTFFYLPQIFRQKNKVKNLEVHLNLSEAANETFKLPKKIIRESVKKNGMKYILYWNEAYDSKGEPTFYHQFKHIIFLFYFYRVWILLWVSALDRSPVSRYKLLFHT